MKNVIIIILIVVLLLCFAELYNENDSFLTKAIDATYDLIPAVKPQKSRAASLLPCMSS